jgi:hypothetical protein
MFKVFSKDLINKKELSNLLILPFTKLVSLFGSAIYTFVLELYVLKTTGSGLYFREVIRWKFILS